MSRVDAAGAATGQRQDRALVYLALACVAVALALAFNPAVFNDGDTSWHLAAGRLILDRAAVPDADPFSFTFAGAPWVAHEWLAEALMAALFRLGGWSAVALMTGLAVAATLFVIGREALRFMRPLHAFAVLLAVAIILMPFVVARPHVLAWPLLAGWTAMLLRVRERCAAPSPLAALWMLAWANLHGSFVAGLVLAGFFALEAVLYDRDRGAALKSWSLFGLASLAASLATPHGVHGVLFPLQVSMMDSLPLIGEWRATDFAEYPAFALALLAAAAIALVRRNSIPPLRLLLLAALGYLAVDNVRHQALFAIVGSLVLLRAVPTGEKEAAPRVSRAGSAAIAAAIAAAVLLRLAIPAERPDSASNPLTALAHVPAELRDRPVLNSYAFGGPLILEGMRPYIDGRADMYGDDFMFEHRRLMMGDMRSFRRAARRWGIEWTIVSPLDPLSRRLDSEPGWRRIYADDWAVVHVASPGSGAAAGG